ncbi:DUF58 domain-containing protein [Acinetobacter sp. ANC 5378]|uniref:DUF58 domain-containing protein n=1 Tax=Acinetobacter sp. ANC 5378 TaxID=2731249 RepID=UPI00149036AF|nr:DUF58 domain-containing protein [Acinetobacter sp. ANC 5378]NNG83188.1 DUF58 domain-containing protein [Acinetobacter sp. ANC 5378]
MSKPWQKWLAKRFQFEKIKQLSQKDILIFIYQQGYLYVVLILITFIAGINYANNLILGFCFLISAILCISFYLTFKQLHELSIEISVNEIGQVGDHLDLQIHFQQPQKQLRYLWIKTDQHLEKVSIAELKQKITLSFFTDTRGKFHYPTVQIYAVYPFGLVRAWTYFYLKEYSWVAPKAAFYNAENKQHQHSFEPDMDEFRELRNFKLGDSLQAVSWKQAARGQGLYIKVFEQHNDQPSVAIHYANMPSTEHEEKLSLMMGLIEQCEQLQCSYAVVLPQAELTLGVGAKQLLQAKKLLAQA